METWLVGGAVRDEQLGLPVNERDWVVVGSTPEAMLERGFKPVGRDFPVFLHPETNEEYALARTERKSAPGHTGFVFHTDPDISLNEDLKRRDLTLNAIAKNADGVLLDPYGGQADIQARILRHVSPAFTEDPLRVLRVARFAARFAALGFTIAPETELLMRALVSNGELSALTAERVWQETRKALASDHPVVFFSTLRDCGALAVLFPELESLFGIPQPAKHHPEIDCGVHTLMVLEQATRLSDNTAVRFAALVHDLGKGTTPETMLPKHHGHEERGVPLIKALCQRLRVPRAWQELATTVARWHLHCHRILELKPATILKVLNATDALRRPQRFEHFLLACEADARGRTGFEDRAYPQTAYLRRALSELQAVDAGKIAANARKNNQDIAAQINRAYLEKLQTLKTT